MLKNHGNQELQMNAIYSCDDEGNKKVTILKKAQII